jgi:L-fuculose-phosphate aldolase
VDFNLFHPRNQIIKIMERIYRAGMTTLSGGNLSILDENGDIWITPAGVDKGSLTWDDIMRVKADGQVKGRHRPSSEFPFHKAIYERRSDFKAIVHAHPTALVAYSIVRKTPPTLIIPQARDIVGAVGYAPYARPGSEALGQVIADTFADGYDTVILENHGVVCGGRDLLEAFHRFETLDFCARLAIKANALGGCRELTLEQMQQFRHTKNYLPEFTPATRTSREKAYRRHIIDIVHRACDHQLMISTQGVVSVRLERQSFLITPTSLDRRLLDISDIVLIQDRKREQGKLPSRSVLLHDRIYHEHPWVQAIITSQPPHSTAFALSEAPFETRSIPESYILLQDIQRLPFWRPV